MADSDSERRLRANGEVEKHISAFGKLVWHEVINLRDNSMHSLTKCRKPNGDFTYLKDRNSTTAKVIKCEQLRCQTRQQIYRLDVHCSFLRRTLTAKGGRRPVAPPSVFNGVPKSCTRQAYLHARTTTVLRLVQLHANNAA